MAGRKFGSTGDESLTWAMNCLVPAAVCRRFEASRIVAFSTGNVYGLTRAGRGGSRETDVPRPVGEYAMSCLGRERMFEHFSRTRGTRVAILRLNYAVEMRYGILVDLAQRVLAGEPIDLAMGYVNVIWQGDANAMALCALAHAASPPLVVNLAGADELSVRTVTESLAGALGRPANFTGVESPDALLSNGARGWSLLGTPRVDVARLIDWTADWIARGRPTIGKPTHFESRDGTFLNATAGHRRERADTPSAGGGPGRFRRTRWRSMTSGRFDERHQRALTRYYAAAGAGGLAVGVHTTQFAIRDPDDRAVRARARAGPRGDGSRGSRTAASAGPHWRRLRPHVAGRPRGDAAGPPRLPRRPAQPGRACATPPTTS